MTFVLDASSSHREPDLSDSEKAVHCWREHPAIKIDIPVAGDQHVRVPQPRIECEPKPENFSDPNRSPTCAQGSQQIASCVHIVLVANRRR